MWCIIIVLWKRRRSALLPPQVIELSRRAAEHRTQALLKELEEELTELRKRSTALSQLALSEDYVHFLKVPLLSRIKLKLKFTLGGCGCCPSPASFPDTQVVFFFFFPASQTFPGLSTHPQTKDWSGVSVVSELTSGVPLRTVSHVMEQMQEEMQKLPESCKHSTFFTKTRRGSAFSGAQSGNPNGSEF